MPRREEFAHQLRGVAALSVVVAHFCGTFFIYRGLPELIQVPPLDSFPRTYGLLAVIENFAILLGQFGVGIFFILSGFVISISLRSGIDGKTFLKRRVSRIFPVYIAGFTVAILAVFSLTLVVGSSFDYSIPHIISHFAIGLRGLLGYSRIDGISWTLEVELTFYLVMALCHRHILDSGIWPLLVAATSVATIAVTSGFLMRNGFYSWVGNTGFQGWAALLLVSGVTFFQFSREKISQRAFLLVQGMIILLLLTVWLTFDRSVYSWQWIGGYFGAMLIFAVTYMAREAVKSPDEARGLKRAVARTLSHLADVSYPLYVVHALLGYSLMYFMVANGYGPIPAILSAISASYVAAYFLHLCIEKKWMGSRNKTGSHVLSPSRG